MLGTNVDSVGQVSMKGLSIRDASETCFVQESETCFFRLCPFNKRLPETTCDRRRSRHSQQVEHTRVDGADDAC